MAGDATNAAQWANADVYVAPVGTAGPADVTSAWATAWKAGGLLDGEEGFTETREDQSSEKYAWGGLLVKRTKSQHKRTITFVALEDNDTIFGIVNPGSTRTVDEASSLTTSAVRVPTSAEFAIGFEVRDGDTVKRRIVKRATVDSIDDVTETESDVTVYSITVVLYPEADGTLYTELKGTLTP
ncbi:hypothetical protein [Actinopolymorpha pittospori]|uniref:Major tail protein n=1 Tax=Actinopolymorpha pittospori TaxID=648752 RepID=A0A927MSS9_9ACTN|nr:hypothetical protein [Actinopolymorpha pittospori]MBE1606245.1 hypothetical protein [Actinopolymorpha pittospori]